MNRSRVYQSNHVVIYDHAKSDIQNWGFREHFGEQSGLVTSDAYNTAWVARVPQLKNQHLPAWPQALDFLHKNQLDDGGWGNPHVYYAHERLISTLASLSALLEWDSEISKPEITIAVRALRQYIQDIDNEAYAPIGFELLLPRLVQNLKQYGLNLSFLLKANINQATTQKLELIGQLKPNWQQPRSWWFNMEVLPIEQLVNLDTRMLTKHGSIITSPAATAAYLRALRKKNLNSIPATYFLQQAVLQGKGGVGVCHPIEGFELIWTLDSYMRAGMDPNSAPLRQLANWLIKFWETSPRGLGWSQVIGFGDGDTTSVGYKVLTWLGASISDKLLLRFWSEKSGYLLNYPDEFNASVSANVHALFAFRHNPNNAEHARMARRIASWLFDRMKDEGQLHDKWHFSPLYATTRIIPALLNWDEPFAEMCIEHVLSEQYENGGWGGTGQATLEETSYAVLALVAAHCAGYKNIKPSLQRAEYYLWKRRGDHPQARLWIGKTLYQPIKVTRALLFAARMALHTAGISKSA